MGKGRNEHGARLINKKEEKKMLSRKCGIYQLLCMALYFLFSSGSHSVSGKEAMDGLSVDNVHVFYFAKDQTLKVMFALLNTGNTEKTVCVENLNTAFSEESDKRICEIGAGIKARYEDYTIIQSLYRFDPVTLRPKEGVAINHMVKRRAEDIDPNAALIVRYMINDEFGKRHNVWFGSVDSAPTKLKVIE